MTRSRERVGLFCGLVAAVIWGGYIAVTRQGIQIGLTAADLAFLRYTTAGLLLLPWLLTHKPMRLADVGWRRGAALALLAGPPFVLVGASGFIFAPLAHSAVIQLGMVTLMGMVLSALLIGERPGRQRIVGMAIIVAGLTTTAGAGAFGAMAGAWKGDLLFAAAGTMWAVFTVLQRRWNIQALPATAAVSVLSALAYTPIYFAWRGAAPLLALDPWVLLQQAVMLGALSGVIALFAFSRAVENLGPGRASLFPAMAPAVAILIGVPVAGEWPTMHQILGLALLSAGLVIALRDPANARPSASPSRSSKVPAAAATDQTGPDPAGSAQEPSGRSW
ncbi:drug/metabolite transporter (DMT)-like permease [Phenylobacterium koreense]|uniref:Drug/metabolite transporter (DMT)-like permease n=1 Tax=Phenylobacterium koreense TaxID=266125 RepID=A0ABV2ENB7_9CAUL